jgi:hypothetical protein
MQIPIDLINECLGKHVMGKAVPSRLPPPFHWMEELDRTHLYLGTVRVLEICRRNLGWIVEIYLYDPAHPPSIVAVRSASAGMRWGARWEC